MAAFLPLKALSPVLGNDARGAKPEARDFAASFRWTPAAAIPDR